MPDRQRIVKHCKALLQAYHEGKLGYMKMPEDEHPQFNDNEERLAYFTLPMSLNYQRDSYKLWKAALQTYQDPTTKDVFSLSLIATMDAATLRAKLLKHKLALQPNKHIQTWQTIAKTVHEHWQDLQGLFKAANNDFLELRTLIQQRHKKGFPYLSGPKIFNYWSFIISTYGKIPLINKQFIEIAPDTHITKCSVRLGVITEEQAEHISKEALSEKWRTLLEGTGINPIDMHPPLWFWSRNQFRFTLS